MRIAVACGAEAASQSQRGERTYTGRRKGK